jgi:hypothetical protein
MAQGEAPKIIVDSDWKSQAQAEKERLAAAEKAAAPKPKPAAPGEPAAGPGGTPGAEGEPVSPFEELVRMLATQALLYMGAFPDPQTGKAIVALDYARLHIDMLGALQEKTKGNLSKEEETLLTQAVHELRLQYVELTKAVAKAVEEGRISQGGRIAPPGAAVPKLQMPKA